MADNIRSHVLDKCKKKKANTGHLHATNAAPPIIKTHLLYLFVSHGDQLHKVYIKVMTAEYVNTTCNIRRP